MHRALDLVAHEVVGAAEDDGGSCASFGPENDTSRKTINT